MAETSAMPFVTPLACTIISTCGVMWLYSRCFLLLNVRYSVCNFIPESLPLSASFLCSLYDGQRACEAAWRCHGCIKISMAKRLTRVSSAPVPDKLTLPALRTAAAGCKACDLCKLGTQTVFGEGGANARVMMVGEQPGDKEDLQGKPFVGPAGIVLDKALVAAGIDRKDVYVTNIVKHFKWEPRGKRRLHKKPNALEISACRRWLEAEIKAVKPEVVVLLGATAAQGIMGRQFRVTQHRGQWLESKIAPL